MSHSLDALVSHSLRQKQHLLGANRRLQTSVQERQAARLSGIKWAQDLWASRKATSK